MRTLEEIRQKNKRTDFLLIGMEDVELIEKDEEYYSLMRMRDFGFKSIINNLRVKGE